MATLAAGLACLTVAVPASAAPGDLPRLKAELPANIEATFFDDHSLGGDNHLSWSAPGAPSANNLGLSDEEDQEVRFQSSVTNTGPGALQLCSFSVGGGWMSSYQIAPGALGACPAGAPNTGQAGWARYIIGGHDTNYAYNRWHQMDLERFAMVPIDHPSAPTVWDSAWGSCMDLGGPYPDCPTSGGTASLATGIAPGATKVLQDSAPDEQIIPISPALDAQLPDGTYQIVDIVNPYRALAESGPLAGSVSCRNFTFATRHDAGHEGQLVATPIAAAPATCQLPTSLPPAVSLGGRDPMAGAIISPCLVGGNGHCWTTPPHADGYVPARTNASGTPTATSTVTVAQGAALGPVSLAAVTPRPVTTAATTQPTTTASGAKGTSGTVGATSAGRRHVMTAVRARAYTRSALRKAFGRGLSRLHVSCRVATSTRSTCTVSWHKHGASYRGKLYVRYRTVRHRLRWQYRVDVAKRLHGHTQHVRRGYRTGGTF